jgi:phage gpG-like protein
VAARLPSLSGLVIKGGITGANLRGAGISMTFEPSMVISAAKVNTLGMKLHDFHGPLHEAIEKVMIPSIHKNFVVGGRPKWQPLSADTLQNRRWAPGLGYVAKPLVRTGALMGAMQDIGIWHIDTQRATLANLPEAVWYGVVHQAGYGGGGRSSFSIRNPLTGRVESVGEDSGEGEIPARPFVVVQRSDEIRIESIFKKWLAVQIAESGLTSIG